MLGYDFDRLSSPQVAREFGQQFADALVELEPGWQGPVFSGYGLHLVFLERKVEGRIPSWTEVRDRLVMDFNRLRTERSKDALYEGLLQKYTVEIDLEAVDIPARGAAEPPDA
jgi:hypothetical protein